MSRVAVIGGGVIGCVGAERLSLERHQVTLLEQGPDGTVIAGIATLLDFARRLVPGLATANLQIVAVPTSTT